MRKIIIIPIIIIKNKIIEIKLIIIIYIKNLTDETLVYNLDIMSIYQIYLKIFILNKMIFLFT